MKKREEKNENKESKNTFFFTNRDYWGKSGFTVRNCYVTYVILENVDSFSIKMNHVFYLIFRKINIDG